MKKSFVNEREGQIEFFDNYGIPYEDDASILVDNTDGVYNGNILEFKLSIPDVNKVLFQAIKYLSRMRIRGESVPATIILIDLTGTTAYIFKAADYMDDIQQVYAGGSSKNNYGFVMKSAPKTIDYSEMIGSSDLRIILKGSKSPDEMYVPIDIDETCIVGWAERYYRELPNASKGDFLGDEKGTQVQIRGEIRDPRHFKGLINPYCGKTNEKFKYLMDCLNDRLSKKDLGAFYTPELYCRKAAELVQMAVDRVPEGNDYIILDRCAGTGNLEATLIGLKDKHGDELISHCIVSTYEYYEYKVLMERIGDKVRNVIPPTEANVVYEGGKVANADAMSREFIENPIIRQYVDDPKCTIILFENPPYSDQVSDNTTGHGRTSVKKSYIFEQMFRDMKTFRNSSIATVRELSNQFIWSGYKFYLRDECDSYIVFSPVKYWKTIGLFDLQCKKAFLFNRKHFHASESCIGCMYWVNKRTQQNSVTAEIYDIEGNELVYSGNILMRKVFHSFSDKYFDTDIRSDDIECDVFCEADGNETQGRRCSGRSYWNKDIIGYLRATALAVNVQQRYLTRQKIYNAAGFYLRQNTYLEKLPLFAAKLFPQDHWYEKDIYFTTSDGGDAYTKDHSFLKACMIYTCLSNQNKCLTFDGSDGRHYQNELCFDNSDPARLPLALVDLRKYAGNKATALDEEEKALLELWYKIMAEARATADYNPAFTYGVYQITKELNTSTVIGTGTKKRIIYDYPVLNGDLTSLRDKLKEYYKSHITGPMFKYKLLK